MASDVLSLFSDSFTSAVSWFTSVFDGVGMAGIYIAFMFIFLVVRYLLSPLLGAGSDRASDQIRKRR